MRVRVCAQTCLEPSRGVRCSSRRSLESLCAAEEQLKEALRERSSRRRREEDIIFFTCASAEGLLPPSRARGSYKAPDVTGGGGD